MSLSKSIVFALCMVFALVLVSGVARAKTPVALELVLAVDASSSVDDEEYALQVAGYVRAFRDADIIAAIEAMRPLGIAVTYVEWSDRWQQVQSVGWTHVHDASGAKAFASAISMQANMLQGSGTAIGDAISFSASLFDGNGYSGLRRVIDISADDRYNSGSHPSLARDRAVAGNITVNALAVDGTGALAKYFQRHVIGGPDAFVLSAQSFADFAAALKMKLLRELQAIGPVSGRRVYLDFPLLWLNVAASAILPTECAATTR